jgi:tRNA (cmo5U34)-methyltransferase
MKENNKIDKDRFFSMAECYDRMAPHLVPGYDMMQESVFPILDLPEDTDITVLDLGAGSGIFLERFLERYKGINALWFDYSRDFMNMAKRRLDRFGNRVTYIEQSFAELNSAVLPGEINCIVSSSAIHHLGSVEKEKLYQKAYSILSSGGWFFNIDEMVTLNEESYRKNMDFWVKHVEMQKTQIPEPDMDFYLKWCSHFDRWKERNIDKYGQPKEEGDDLHDPFVNQVKWLRRAGFRYADVYVKYHLWCTIGGQKLI